MQVSDHNINDDDDNDNNGYSCNFGITSVLVPTHENDDNNNNNTGDKNDNADNFQAGITAGISLAVLVPVACCIVCLLQRYMGGGAE